MGAAGSKHWLWSRSRCFWSRDAVCSEDEEQAKSRNTVLVAAGAGVHTQAASRQSSKGDGNQSNILAFRSRQCVTAQIPGTKVLCKTETKPESDSQ